ncbi:Glycoprotein 3-alpha-L-fucosyltransferase A [Nymphon striatum]|nr:Glycoprotein 3-alpha-L-fucosyltransferase A [Nymphon striatum]
MTDDSLDFKVLNVYETLKVYNLEPIMFENDNYFISYKISSSKSSKNNYKYFIGPTPPTFTSFKLRRLIDFVPLIELQDAVFCTSVACYQKLSTIDLTPQLKKDEVITMVTDQADVVIHLYETMNLQKGFHDGEHQISIFFSMESSATDYSRGKEGASRHLSDRFHVTSSYRLDSDIPSPYGKIRLKKRRVKGRLANLRHAIGKKKFKVAWMVSNCLFQPSKRNELVQELRKYISVDIFGECGSKKCSRNRHQMCAQMVSEQYKFYLSLENSICKDYITEKFFSWLPLNVVPVVLGGGDYRSIAPPKSYIDVTDFDSAKSLAEYLLDLDRNATKYEEYLKWKLNYDLEVSYFSNQLFCDICRKLTSIKNSRDSMNITNFPEWYNRFKCYSWGNGLNRTFLDEVYGYDSKKDS